MCIAQTLYTLQDLSSFKEPGKTWKMAGGVSADLEKQNILNTTSGNNIIVNLPDKKNHGVDLYTKASYGDIDLDLDYMMATG